MNSDRIPASQRDDDRGTVRRRTVLGGGVGLAGVATGCVSWTVGVNSTGHIRATVRRQSVAGSERSSQATLPTDRTDHVRDSLLRNAAVFLSDFHSSTHLP